MLQRQLSDMFTITGSGLLNAEVIVNEFAQLDVAAENILAAQNRIRDLDYSHEVLTWPVPSCRPPAHRTRW